MNKEPVYEKIPDFIPENKNIVENHTIEEKVKIVPLKRVESGVKSSLTEPSQLKIDQSSMIVDFDTYKGNSGDIYQELCELYSYINNWDEDTTFKITEYLLEKDFMEIINKIAYIPNNTYLGNVIEIIGSLIENGNIELGSINDTEIVFQNLKRIYNHRVQLILLPLLLYVYHLDRKLLPAKQTAWQVLNKNGRFFEASIIMSDIQKSQIRIKKAQELLTQERYNLEKEIKENIDLLMILSGQRSVLFPVYKAYKESISKEDFSFEKYFLNAYAIDNTPIKPLAQQLLTYKIGEAGQKIMNGVASWSGKNSEPQFINYLNSIYSIVLDEVEIDAKSYFLLIRDIIFVSTDIAKKRNWNIAETISDIIISIFTTASILDKNDLRMISYIIASQIMTGILKIKYKPEEAVSGLAKAVINIYSHFDKSEEYKIFSEKINHKIIVESFYNAIWDTSLEMYPSLINIEKNLDLFVNALKNENINFKK